MVFSIKPYYSKNHLTKKQKYAIINRVLSEIASGRNTISYKNVVMPKNEIR